MKTIIALPFTLLQSTLGALLFSFALLLPSESAFAFGKSPTATPPTSPTDSIDARWNSTSAGPAWSQFVYNSIPSLAPNLLNVTPADISSFCPAYGQLTVSDKMNFWVYLTSSITQLESDFDPTSVYTENFNDENGNPVQSVGLMQLSIGDASIYGCTSFNTTTEIEDPDTNLACGLRILNRWIGSDGVIARQNNSGNWIGAARYWSTLRSQKLETIQTWTRSLSMCGG